jgi:hypothetical protein
VVGELKLHSRCGIAVALIGVMGGGLLAGCRKSPASQSSQKPDEFDAISERLHAFEETQRSAIDFSRARPWSDRAGPDPIRVAAFSGSLASKKIRAVGLLRNAASVVLLDEQLHEAARLAAPKSPTGLAVNGDTVFVCGELSPLVMRYQLVGGAFVASGFIRIAGATGLRDVAVGPEGVLYVADEHDGKWLAISANERAWTSEAPFEQREYPAKIAPFRIARVGAHVIVDDLLAHSLTVVNVDAKGFPILASAVSIVHDGPIWSFDAKDTANGLVIAAGGVEDRPLDRSGGFFGWIDSFVFLYRVENGVATKIATQNVSELGVITPKALSLDVVSDKSVSVFVTGYGGENAARLVWNIDDGNVDNGSPASITTGPLAPGSAAMAEISAGSYVVANTLLDGWENVSERGSSFVPASSSSARSTSTRVGEALFFTSLMAPNNSSDGAHSRFTCETCHFEGYVDGRTHFTGREDIHASTKPLRGLVSNRPHFSRALDPDLATVAVNEFRVASAGSDTSEWFTVNPAEFPWVHELGANDDLLSPEDLRRDLIAFLIDFTHDENPQTGNRQHLSATEAQGAEAFHAHCEGCHEARLAADDPKSRVPFAEWNKLIFNEHGTIVWGRATYEKTGVVPYVHELGTRVPGLRRLYKKRPYFTNGSAQDLASVLSRARSRAEPSGYGTEFFHDHAPPDATPLSAEDRDALIAFLGLL